MLFNTFNGHDRKKETDEAMDSDIKANGKG